MGLLSKLKVIVEIITG